MQFSNNLQKHSPNYLKLNQTFRQPTVVFINEYVIVATELLVCNVFIVLTLRRLGLVQ